MKTPIAMTAQVTAQQGIDTPRASDLDTFTASDSDLPWWVPPAPAPGMPGLPGWPTSIRDPLPPHGLPRDTDPRPLTWTLPTGGIVSATVYGSTYSVDTADLFTLATALSAVSDHLDAAAAYLRTQTAQLTVNSAATAAHTAFDLSLTAAACTVASLGAVGGLGMLGIAGIPGSDTTAVERLMRYRHAYTCLAAAQDGPGSLDDVSTQARTLSADIREAAQRYDDAEARSHISWAPQIAGLMGISHHLAIPPGGWMTIEALRRFAGDPQHWDLPEGVLADALDDMHAVMADASLCEWIRRDLLILLVLGLQAMRANTSEEAALIDAYLAQSAARLDPHVTRLLPDSLPHGSKMVPTVSLTPMQRVTAYLARIGADAGTERFGQRTAIRLTAHGGPSVIIPAAHRDPLGLNTPLPATALLTTGAAVGLNRPISGASDRATTPGIMSAPTSASAPTPLRTPSDVIRYSDGLKKHDSDPSSGVISLVRTDHTDGTRSWLVVIPGTTYWGMGGSNPQDMLTNLEAVAGLPTDMESSVVTAMRMAGVAPDDPVAFYGHSQGAITAANLAADPAVNAHFHITSLLTVGGPVAGTDVPTTVNTLHIENGADAVTALDARATPIGPQRITLRLDTTKAGLDGYPHGSLYYADALDGMPDDPTIAQWNNHFATITGAHEPGATHSDIVMDIERLTTPPTQTDR